MLACGSVCQPNYIKREIKAYSSNANPIHVLTDVGSGFVKAPNNPIGAGLVIAELVAAELGHWFELNIPPFAVINECQIELVMERNGEAMVGPLFYSSQIEATAYDGSIEILNKVRNKNQLTKLVIFDTWLCNWDRWDDLDENLENLLIAKNRRRFDIYAIDHTYAFDGTFPTSLDQNMLTSENVYGNFPQFAPYINYDTVSKELELLSELNRDFVEQIVNSVPAEWGLGQYASRTLIDFICQRAEFVVNTLPARILVNPPIPGLQGNG